MEDVSAQTKLVNEYCKCSEIGTLSDTINIEIIFSSPRATKELD